MIRAFLLVGLGGFFGSIARYGISHIINKYITNPFPYATFIVNILGCFLIGLLFGLGQRSSWMEDQGWLILATGFCGAFTTFSTFALENNALINEQRTITSILYIATSVAIGLLLCRWGMNLMK
ncbi:MAG: fluoride efflux transporter CrcB [Flavipsychrobacter sp.]